MRIRRGRRLLCLFADLLVAARGLHEKRTVSHARKFIRGRGRMGLVRASRKERWRQVER